MSGASSAGRRAAVVGALVALLCLVIARVLAVPVDEFGSNGAAWAEHRARLGWASALLEQAAEDVPKPLPDLIQERATGFPPGLHLVAWAARPLLGDGALAHALLGLVWLLVLAAAVATVARKLFGAGSLAAFAGVLVVPALHAAAPRYYYDFPMVAASWAAVAVLAATMDRRVAPLGGALAGAVAVGAALLKWTALPTAAPLALGLLLAPTADRRPALRVAAALAFAAVLGAGVAGFLALEGPDNSLVAMVQESRVAELPDAGEQRGGLGSIVASVAGALTTPQASPGPRFAWYVVASVAGILSPAGALLLLALVPLRRRELLALAPMLVVMGIATKALLLLLVAPVDERFLLGPAPLAVLLGTAGWLNRSERGRRRAGAVVLGVGLLLAADVHHGPRAPWNAPLELRVLPTDVDTTAHIPPLTVRGLSLASSFERRGWARRDDLVDPRTDARQAAWRWVLACGARTVLIDVDQPLLGPEGDFSWFEYAGAAEEIAGRPTPGIQALDCAEPTPPGSLVLAPWPDRARARPPRCPAGASIVEVIAAPDGGPHVAAWSPEGLGTCAAVRAAAERATQQGAAEGPPAEG